MAKPLLKWVKIFDPEFPPAPFECAANHQAYCTFAVSHEGKVYSIDLTHGSPTPAFFVQVAGSNEILACRDLHGSIEDPIDQLLIEAEQFILSPLELLASVKQDE